MEIDVVDLNFKTLNFARGYDQSRYKRGRNIYDEGLAAVESVEKFDEENYFVEASVEGNYDTYTTTLRICNNMINDWTCTCEDYYKGNLCKHIIATSMEVISPHFASTQEGYKKLKEKRKEEERIRLEQIKEQQELERKRREYESKYYNGLRTIESFKQSSKQAIKSTLDLAQIYEETAEIKSKKTGQLATSIKIEYCAELQDSKTLKVSFKIGQTRMYVLNNICDFYEAYKNGNELYYGKQLRFIPNRENFTKDSQVIFDFIIKYAEMIEYNKYSDYGISSSFNKFIYITSENIDDFFSSIKNKGILFHSYYGGDSKYEFTDEKLDITCTFKKEKVKIPVYNYWSYNSQEEKESEEYVLKLNITDYSILLSSSKLYVFYKDKIYTMEKDTELIKLFNMFARQEQILIPEDKLEEFKRFVLPQIKYIEIGDLPANIAKEGFIVNKLASKILLDVDDKGDIMLELKFCYMDYEFNILENGYRTYVKKHNIIRDVPAETEVIKRLFMDGFEFVSGKKQFIMKDEDDIYEFLLHKIEG